MKESGNSPSIPPGYKQTEVGVIPIEWRVSSVESIAAVGRGRVISHRDITRARNPEYPIYSSQTSNEGVMGYIDTYDFEGEYVTWTTDGANAGTVFARNGRFNCTNVCGTLKLKSDNHIFVALVLSRFAPPHVSRHVGNPKLMNDVMKRVQIPLPSSRQEQDAIATALSDVDALLSGLDRLIAKKRDLKQAAMQQLLTGQTRLPGFHGEWEVKRLGELGRFLKGSGVKKDEARAGDLPCIRYGEIYTQHNDYVRSFNSWISREVAERATLLQRGDVLFAGSGETKEEIGKCVAFVDDVEAYAGGDIVILRPTRANSLFLGYFLNAPTVASQKASRGQGDAVVHISASALGSITVSLPSLDEQAAIAAVLSDMDAELAALEARRAKTRDLKQAMMQELLTGRTRLV